jgi:uncharacterized membrane protein
MDATHFHLILTHFPIVGTIIGIGILIYGQYSKNNVIKKIALAIFVGMCLITIPVFLTGEGAEESVENIAGISENIIEEHEELAEKAIWLMGVLGLLSSVGLYAIKAKLSITRKLNLVILAVSIITFILFAKVGNLGGQIRHTEIQSNSMQVPLDYDDAKDRHFERDDDDDDDD